MEILDEKSERGVTETRFDSKCEGRRVPAVVWRPEEVDARAVVLIGHTVGQHKQDPVLLSTARRFVRHHNIAALAIDGPGHGDREGAAIGGNKTWWTPTAIDDSIADWKHVTNEVKALPGFGDVKLGYWGMSLGTWIGIPLVKADQRIKAAVFGLAGYSPIWRRVGEDATGVRCPVRYFAQRQDELVRPDAAKELFDMLGSADKELRMSDGDHLEIPVDEWNIAENFLADQLTA